MKSKVENLKLPIPDEWLSGVNEVEIRREQDVIVIIPVHNEDPIRELGSQPICFGYNRRFDESRRLSVNT